MFAKKEKIEEGRWDPNDYASYRTSNIEKINSCYALRILTYSERYPLNANGNEI